MFISPNFLGYLILTLVGIVGLVALQYHYWYGESGYYELAKLQKEVAKQQKINAEQEHLNAVLMADIADLKSGFGAVEEHARLNLGFIKQGETFVQLSTANQVYADEKSVIDTDVAPATEPIDVFGESKP
ncbi:cell division protein FtsB [Moraxella sp. VT-16-12]|nr:cell division protein FtsB [Moraxella sp. VT-16-12]